MIKRDEIKGPSCLTNAADDEPIFVLRANDEIAPALVLKWAYNYRALKGGDANMTDRQRAKCLEAISLAHAMEEWKLRHSAYGGPK
jgi:hypothetical protein